MNTGHDVEDVAIKMSADTHAEKRVLRTRHDIATEGCLKSRSGHTKIQPPPSQKKSCLALHRFKNIDLKFHKWPVRFCLQMKGHRVAWWRAIRTAWRKRTPWRLWPYRRRSLVKATTGGHPASGYTHPLNSASRPLLGRIECLIFSQRLRTYFPFNLWAVYWPTRRSTLFAPSEESSNGFGAYLCVCFVCFRDSADTWKIWCGWKVILMQGWNSRLVVFARQDVNVSCEFLIVFWFCSIKVVGLKKQHSQRTVHTNSTHTIIIRAIFISPGVSLFFFFFSISTQHNGTST